MKKATAAALLVLIIAVAAGCAGAAINQEAFTKVKYAGILSLTVKKCGPVNAGNEEVIQAVANYALGQAEAALKKVRSFKMVSAGALYKVPEYQNAGTVAKATGALAYLKNNPEAMNQDMKTTETSGDFMTALKAGLKAAADSNAVHDNPAAAAQARLDKFKEELAGAAGLPFIPYQVINNNTPGTTTVTYVNGVKQGGENEGLKMTMIEEAKAVCAKTRLDAVIIVFVDTAADKPKGVYVITGGNRVLGTLRLNMTMVMIDKNGEIIYDLDWPSMDDLAPMRLAHPSNIVTKWYTQGKSVAETAVDLKDPGGDVLRNYKEMVVESSNRMVETLRKDLGEIK